ncbi:MAG: hypothetical protein JWN03_7930 [Nocardia sp.]|nr:hypothetical protein [Nocardia sp.]
MWRAEGSPRTRSAGVVVELLESEPEWERLVAAHWKLIRRIPRLGERVVEPLLPLVMPVWAADPAFDLSYHLQQVRVPGAGSLEELNELVAAFAAQPRDPRRPPWEAVLVCGIAGGKSAYLLKLHHSLCDGLGMLQLLDLTHGHGPQSRDLGRVPVPARGTTDNPARLLVRGLRDQLASAPGELLRVSVDAAARFRADPVGAAAGALRFADSLRRILATPPASGSAVWRDRGIGYRVLTLNVPLGGLKAAGRAAGGSVNDAFLAALLGAVRHYHERVGAVVGDIPMAIPVSLRTDRDPLGGNRFAGARFAAPAGEADPRARIMAIHDVIAGARAEPAIGFPDLIAPLLSRLPGALLTDIAATMTEGTDVQASNMGGVGRTLYLAGARVSHIYPVGPRPGVAAMVTMVSYRETCCVAVNLDPEAISDVPGFADCLRTGFDEVLELAD